MLVRNSKNIIYKRIGSQSVSNNFTSSQWVELYNLFHNNPTKKYELTITKADGSVFIGMLTNASNDDVPTQLYEFQLNGGDVNSKDMMVRGGGAGYWGGFAKLNFINAGTGNPVSRTSGEIKSISYKEIITYSNPNEALQSLFSWWNTSHNFNYQNLGIFSPRAYLSGVYNTAADALTYLQTWQFTTYTMETKGTSHPNQQWSQITAGASSGAGSTGDFHTEMVISGQGWNGLEFFYNAALKTLEISLYKAYINTFNGIVKGITLPTITLIPQFQGTSTTSENDVKAFFVANGETITNDTVDVLASNWKLEATLSDGTIKTWPKLTGFYFGDPYTMYPSTDNTNHTEIMTFAKTVWGNYNKWLFYNAGTDAPDAAGRKGLVVNSFKIIKV